MPCVPAKLVCPRGWESCVKVMMAPRLSKSLMRPLQKFTARPAFVTGHAASSQSSRSKKSFCTSRTSKMSLNPMGSPPWRTRNASRLAWTSASSCAAVAWARRRDGRRQSEEPEGVARTACSFFASRPRRAHCGGAGERDARSQHQSARAAAVTAERRTQSARETGPVART